MLKRILPPLVFITTLALAFFLYLQLDTAQEAYMGGELLSEEWLSSVRPVAGLRFDPDRSGFAFEIRSTGQRDISIALSSVRQFNVYQDGESIVRRDNDSSYQKAVVVPLKPFDGITSILITGADQSSPIRYKKLNVLIGGTDVLDRRMNEISGWSHLALGLLLALGLSGAILYGFKPSEKYLLSLAIGAFLNMINLAIPLNLLGISVSYALNATLGHTLLVACVLYLAWMCVSLYDESLPSGVRRLLHPGILLAVLAVFPFLSEIPYNICRFLLCIPVVVSLTHAARQKRFGAYLMLMCYAIMEATILFMFMHNHIDLPMGPISGLWRMSEIAQSVLLTCAFIVVCRRFAGQFILAENLNRELENMNEHLEDLVQQRTAELREQQEQKHAMMQNIFHDVRSPIQILKRCIDQQKADDCSPELVEKMDTRLTYLDRLVSNLFLISKLESKKIIFDEDDVPMHEIAREISVASSEKKNGIRVVCEASDPCIVWGDRLRLTQMLQNIVDNAIHHSPKDQPVLLSINRVDTNAVITVTDFGKGIAPEDLPHVFQRYYQSKLSHDPESFGLGLSIAKEIAEAHGGTISVLSPEGQGARFVIELPLIDEAE